MKAVLITGASGGIGCALVEAFHANGYHVIATDIAEPREKISCAHFIQADLEKLVEDDGRYSRDFFASVQAAVGDASFCGLINNAAIQIVGSTAELTTQDWKRTLNVNTIAPFLLTQAMLPLLEKAQGAVVNISSVHSTLTKPNFISYATSKAALSGLTRSMAVELGKRIRINAIAPAAVETPMLKAGFEGRKESYNSLANMHPIGRIANPNELAELALFLVSSKAQFINGAVFQLDGGISARLNDPE